MFLIKKEVSHSNVAEEQESGCSQHVICIHQKALQSTEQRLVHLTSSQSLMPVYDLLFQFRLDGEQTACFIPGRIDPTVGVSPRNMKAATEPSEPQEQPDVRLK